MKYTGIALILLGAATLGGKILDALPFLEGGIVVALILGAPALGAFLLFAARSLARPAGIDNDDVYRRSLTARGVIGVCLGVVLTLFYVVIYLGDDVRLGAARDAVVTIDRAGRILTVDGPAADTLRTLCWQCPQKSAANAWWQGAQYRALLPYNGAYHKLVQSALDTTESQASGPVRASDAYELTIATPARADQAEADDGTIKIRFTVKDTLHHLAGRHIYPLWNPLARLLTGQSANNWFVYGTLYTLGVLVFGVRMLFKYRHNNYQIIRTISVMAFQLGFAYMLPNLLKLFKQPEFYFSYFWPLKPEYFYPSTWAYHGAQQNAIGLYFLGFGALMSFVAVPLLTFLYGKRWYCSWVCGCGGLAETMGDPFRQLSDKSLQAWRLERYLIHSVLVIITLITALLWANSFAAGALLGEYSQSLTKAYGLYIGAIFSGIIGVGFYPIFGSRVWCRFGCPLAAILGIFQKFASRFRITSNGGQCISCGNCSTYCEMGIDVRWYAQRGQNIIRASCVGCGVCAAVCPRGVLRLENGPVESIFTRYNDPAATTLR